MASYKKKDRNYSEWFDDEDFSQFVGSVHDGQGSITDAENGVLPGGKDWVDMYYQYWTMQRQNQWQQDMYLQDREWQQDMYERYQTLPAQVSQMRQAGINPAMMFAGSGVNAPAVQSSSVPSSGSGASAPSSSTPATNSTQRFMSAFQAVLGLLGQGSSVAQGISSIIRNSAMNNKDKAQAALFEEQKNTEKDKQYNLASDSLLKQSQAALNEIDKIYRDRLNGLKIEKERNEVAKTWAEYQKVISDIDVNKSIIEINGKKFELLNKDLDIKEQELALSQIKVIMAHREEMMQEDMLELQKEYLNAQVLLTNAKTETEHAVAEEAHAQATKALWDAMKEKKLIDVGYYEQQVKNMKTQNSLAIVDCVVGNAVKISGEVLGWFTGGLSKVGSNLGNSTPHAKVPTLYGSDGKTPMTWSSY